MARQSAHDQKVLNSVAHLQEFYDNDDLHAFFHQCEQQDCDIPEAFLVMDASLNEYVRAHGVAPAFVDLAASYAGVRGWKFSPSRREVSKIIL